MKDSTAPPIDDPNHKETLGRYLDYGPELWLGYEYNVLRWIWEDDGRNIFNLTMDRCVPKDAIVGIYQFANGTSKNDATIYEISEDLLEFGFSKRDGHRTQRFASQTLANAQLAVKDIEAFLDDHTVCDSTSDSGSDRTELRRLLVEPNDLADGYWVAVFTKATVAAGSTGLAAAVGAGIGPFNATAIEVRLTLLAAIPFFAQVTFGVIDRAQKQGRLSFLGAFFGSLIAGITRQLARLAGSIETISECDSDVESQSDGITLTPYANAMSALSAQHPPQGPQCPP